MVNIIGEVGKLMAKNVFATAGVSAGLGLIGGIAVTKTVDHAKEKKAEKSESADEAKDEKESDKKPAEEKKEAETEKAEKVEEVKAEVVEETSNPVKDGDYFSPQEATGATVETTPAQQQPAGAGWTYNGQPVQPVIDQNTGMIYGMPIQPQQSAQ